MSLTSKPGVRIVNDLLHDTAAGAWPGAVLMLWTARGLIATGDPISLRVKLLSGSWILGAALALLLVTGALRLNYYELNLRSGTLQAKHRMVVVKHVAFTALLVGSSVAFWYLLPAVS